MVESFLALLDGRPAARTVWMADLDYWIAGQEEKHVADQAWRTEEGFLDLCHFLDSVYRNTAASPSLEDGAYVQRVIERVYAGSGDMRDLA